MTIRYASPAGTGNGLSSATPDELQDVLDAAADGDTINLAAGTYTDQYNIKAQVLIVGTFTGVYPNIVHSAIFDSRVGGTGNATKSNALTTYSGTYTGATRTEIRGVKIRFYKENGIYLTQPGLVADCTIEDIFETGINFYSTVSTPTGHGAKGVFLGRRTSGSFQNAADGSSVRRTVIDRAGEQAIGVNKVDQPNIFDCRILSSNCMLYPTNDAAAGIKLVTSSGARIYRNYFSNTNGRQLWFDVNSGLTSANYVSYNNFDQVANETSPQHSHIFYEISQRGIIVQNTMLGGNVGVAVTDSGNLRIYNNTILDPYAQGVLITDDNGVRNPAGHDPVLPPSSPTSDWKSRNIEFVNNCIVAESETPYVLQVTQFRSSTAETTPVTLANATLAQAKQMVTKISNNAYYVAAAADSSWTYQYGAAGIANDVNDAMTSMRAESPSLEVGSMPGSNGVNDTQGTGTGFNNVGDNPFILISTYAPRSGSQLVDNGAAVTDSDVLAASGSAYAPSGSTYLVNGSTNNIGAVQ